MAKDEREEEEEFLAWLKARHGKDLAEWMAAISAQGFTDKNETIDWLRTQGIPFARASWLERIHHNGGKPIYAHAPAGKPASDPPRPAPRRMPERPAQKPLSAGDAALMEKLIAAGKGYRPLYHLLEEEIRNAIPEVALSPAPAYVSVGAPKQFAAVAILASEVRLGLALGERPFDAHLQKAKLKGAGGDITHMLVLTDARQINGELLDLLRTANTRVNS